MKRGIDCKKTVNRRGAELIKRDRAKRMERGIECKKTVNKEELS